MKIKPIKFKMAAALLLLVAQTSFAETCPDVKTVKSSALSDWTVHDSDDDSLLKPGRAAAFKKHIEQFTLAEWVTSGKHKGSIRCYYSDNNGSGLEAYLTKQSFKPTNPHHYWYQVSGSMHCAAGMNECLFKHTDLSKQPQLARA